MRHIYIEFCTKTYGSRFLDDKGEPLSHVMRVLMQLDADGESTCRIFFGNGTYEDFTWSPYRVVDLHGEPVTCWGNLSNRPRLPAPKECVDCGLGGLPCE